MWQRFTERARRIVFFAQEEAGRLGENHVGTEHLLLGLTRESDSAAAKMLESMSISMDRVREEVKSQVTKGEHRLSEDMQLTPRAKRVIDLAYDEARALQHDYIGSEHLLLGLIREGEGLASRILANLGADIDTARGIVKKTQKGAHSPTLAEKSGAMPTTGVRMKGKHLLEIAALTKAEIEAIFAMAKALKGEMAPERQRRILEGKTLAMIFEKPSLRTRVSFETGMHQLGGHAIYLAPQDISLGKRESVADVARNLGRMVDIIMARVFEHETVTGLAKYAGVPVINGLCDLEHPCQALADFQTIIEKKGDLKGLKLAFIGDGNNVAHSLMLLAAKVGTDFAIGCPEGYEPSREVLDKAQFFAGETGATVEVVYSAAKAAEAADIVYTDVWASMGQEAETEKRAKAFADFQVNAALMKHAKSDAIFMHCLPAHRGSEVTDEVIDSPQSVVFDEAENRLHAQKAVMALVAGS